MILVIDNYDSFVHNVTRYLRELGADAEVVRNDALVASEIGDDYEAIVLSPGPCTPHEAGASLDIVRAHSGHLPILGICLGHQCIGEAFGATITRARSPLHGEASIIRHDGRGVLTGLPDGFNAGRYHSLIVELDGESPLDVTARSEDGEIMGLQHRTHPTFGVQFHPESILTEHGYDILRNFLSVAR
jgi:anthranilate synthase component 2/para-aminobenzoate synthetase component 2